MLTENQSFANRYVLKKRLGQGAFSEVWKAEDNKAGLIVALKIYAPDKGIDEDGIDIFSSELRLVFNVSHKNLLTPTYFDDFNGSPYLVLPFCEKGNAQKLVGRLDEQQVAKFMFDVSNAIAFLHHQNPPIIHQDIKPENVLIDSTGLYRVTDFGISTNLRNTLRKSMGISHVNDNAGTMAYMGPERFNKSRETIKASDVWSLGATVYEMMCGDVPFGEFGGLAQKNGADMPDIEGNYSNGLKNLVLKCLSESPWDRPTAADVCEICYQYNQRGYWDLNLLNKKSSPSSQNGNQSHSRGTQRKVTVAENAEEVPGKTQRIVSSPQPNQIDDAVIQNIESLQNQGMYKEAYNACLDLIKRNIYTDYAKDKTKELLPYITQKIKKGNRKESVIYVVVCILITIIFLIITIISII